MTFITNSECQIEVSYARMESWVNSTTDILNDLLHHHREYSILYLQLKKITQLGFQGNLLLNPKLNSLQRAATSGGLFLQKYI